MILVLLGSVYVDKRELGGAIPLPPLINAVASLQEILNIF